MIENFFQVWCSSSLNIKLWMCVIKGICLGPCINKHWGLTGIWVLGAENYKIFHCCPNKFWATIVRRRRCSRTTIFISLSPKNCPKGSHRGWKWKIKLTNGNYQPASCGAERGEEKGIYANTVEALSIYAFSPIFPHSSNKCMLSDIFCWNHTVKCRAAARINLSARLYGFEVTTNNKVWLGSTHQVFLFHFPRNLNASKSLWSLLCIFWANGKNVNLFYAQTNQVKNG